MSEVLYFSKILIVTCVATLALGSGCNFRQEKTDPSQGGLFVKKGQVDFALVREQVLVPRCQGCHSPAGRGSQIPLSTFEQVQALIPKIRETVFQKRSMPPPDAPQLSALQSNTLSMWLDDGAPEMVSKIEQPQVDAPRMTEGGLERPVRWAVVREKVFEPACMSCHGDKNPDGLSSFTTIEGVRSTIGTTYYTAVVDMSMPPKDSGLVLTTEQKDILSFWITDGMKD